MPRAFDASEPSTALRIYLVLIGCAARRETITYGDLARRVKRGGPNLLATPLDMITKWCTSWGQPQIASLVVEQATGMPAPGFTAVPHDRIPSEQTRVFEYDWFSFFPPTVEELAKKDEAAN